MPETAVEMRGIVKRFGSIVANAGIDLSVDAGEILALLGENGAGKSTLMKILYGLHQPDAGTILLRGEAVRLRSPADAIAHGIGMVSQHFALVPGFSVAENMLLGNEGRLVYDRAAAEAAAAATAERFGIQVQPAARIGSLSIGEQQRVEILKALHRHARVLILDEPTAVLTPQEATALFAVLKQLAAQGLSVIFISHKLDEVLAVADRVTVLRAGRSVGSVATAGASATSLAALMVGDAAFGVERGGRTLPGPPILTLHDIEARNERGLPALRGISLQVHGGEVLGIAGVAGNGQRELAEVISGLRQPERGSLQLDGRNMMGASPGAIAEAGVGRIPEDRASGVVGSLSVAENLALEHLAEFTRRGWLDWAAISAHAERLISEYNIKAAVGTRTETLSGGNMQKVILARVLSRRPRLVLAAEPTRGLDIGATSYVRSKLLEQRAAGAAVLLISQDLEEILSLSDRIAVIFDGRILGVLPAERATAEQLGLLMAGREVMHG